MQSQMAKPLSRETISKEATYGKLALAHARIKGLGGREGPPLPTITPNTAAWRAWERYFISHLGFEPITMKRVRAGMQQEMTVPAERPEDFDGSYRPPQSAA